MAEELFFEVSEEVPHHGFVVAVALAGHRLGPPALSNRVRHEAS
ncbi:hypothetical protein ABFP37_21985 [Burkholderia sp. RS01]